MRVSKTAAVTALAIASTSLYVQAQNFGMAKTKVNLERKLPALYHLPGNTIRVRVTGHANEADLANDLQMQLETELLKDNSQLQDDENNPEVTINCQITNYDHPAPIFIKQPAIGNQPPATNVRITGHLDVAFQAKTRDGRVLGSDNVQVNYDQQFDSAGNNVSHGIMGGLHSSWHRIKGGKGTDDQEDQAPTAPELRSLLLDSAVHRIAENIVNTKESIEVFLAKNKGPIDEGDKAAEAGLWERALETFETAQPLAKHEDDAYRLYDIGVANEALGYAAGDPKSAMKFLQEAAIDYGKAVDAKQSEKYFLGPQRRIETAIMHYRKLEEEKNAPPPVMVAANPPPEPKPDPTPAAPKTAAATTKPAAATVKTTPATHHAAATRSGTTQSGNSARALNNAQIIAMAKAGMAEDTIAAAVKTAKAVDFDLSSEARRRLEASGVSPVVVSAMKVRWAHELASGN
jgi:tetratricopeptide (TPR) repeat protein